MGARGGGAAAARPLDRTIDLRSSHEGTFITLSYLLDFHDYTTLFSRFFTLHYPIWDSFFQVKSA